MSKITLGDLSRYDKTAVDAVMAEPVKQEVLQSVAAPLHVKDRTASVWPFLCGVLVGFLVGAVFCRYEESTAPDDDQQAIVIPDDSDRKPPVIDEKPTPKASHLVFVTEVGEMSAATKKLYDRLLNYCESNSMQLRRYDTEQKSSERYIEFASSKGITPPFIVYSKDGKPIAVESAEKMEAKLR